MDAYKHWVKRNAHWLPAIMGLLEVHIDTHLHSIFFSAGEWYAVLIQRETE